MCLLIHFAEFINKQQKISFKSKSRYPNLSIPKLLNKSIKT